MQLTLLRMCMRGSCKLPLPIPEQRHGGTWCWSIAPSAAAGSILQWGGMQGCVHQAQAPIGIFFSPGFAKTLKRWLIIFRKLNNFYG